jgi:hypothetical protein
MKKALLSIAAIALVATPAAFAGSASSYGAPTLSSANSTEVRYTSTAGLRKGSTVSKLTITRDSSGRIISVKRG